MNALGLLTLVPIATVVLLGNRRWALCALLAGVLFLTQAQSINLAGFNLFAIRILEVIALLRVIFRGELWAFAVTRVDRAVMLLYGFTITVSLLRSDGAWSSIVGITVDAGLSYFICRSLLKSLDELVWVLGVFAIMLVPFVMLLSIEMTTHENPFAAVGGLTFGERGDRIRCMGSFRHPSLLGTLGAAFLPMYVALLRIRGAYKAGVLGCVLCIAIVFCANSGGPVSAAGFGIVSWLCWSLRHRMSIVRRTLAGMLVLLAIVMKAPIWYLPAKASVLSGGDGWHRSFLMQTAFDRIGSWWMAGIDMSSTTNWFGYTLAATGSADITNQYLFFGLTAGVAAIALFVSLLVKAFSVLGGAMMAARRSTNDAAATESEYLFWGVGCCIVVHAANWFGITYNFDQTYWLWSLQLSAVSVAANAVFSTPNAVEPLPMPRLVWASRRVATRSGEAIFERLRNWGSRCGSFADARSSTPG